MVLVLRSLYSRILIFPCCSQLWSVVGALLVYISRLLFVNLLQGQGWMCEVSLMLIRL